MKNLICKNCGGSMVLDPSARTARCHYCGATYLLDHQDTDYFLDFYRQMERFLSGGQDETARRINAEAIWNNADSTRFTSVDNQIIDVRHLHTYRSPYCDAYVARSNIIFHFHQNLRSDAEVYSRMVSSLDYPSADVRNLSDFFPRITGGFRLADGTHLLVISKTEDEYPLRLFGTLSARHVAWIISRLENLCCVLEFSGLVHPGISPDTVFIDPYTHQASLYGGWWEACKVNTLRPGGKMARSFDSLMGLRQTAAAMLGFPQLSDVRYRPDVPKPMIDFLTSIPKDTAYEDFALWDKTLIAAFGERKFIQMDTDDGQIYRKRV
ncbi:MAG: hypothetical protein IJV82_06640 [Oscillospiraceae bacterium]|nr:hypothetical protein [Oscillospiraceae bacterium]